MELKLNKTNDYLTAVFNQPNFLSDEVINDVLLNSKYRQEGEELWDGPTSSPFSSSKLNSRICKIYELHNPAELVKHILNFINQLNNNCYKFNLIGIPSFDVPSRVEYQSVVGGKFDQHTDIGPGHLSTRKISFSIQLSSEDDYEGGDLTFYPNYRSPEEIVSYRRKGTLIIFPSYRSHSVTPVTKGIRNSIVGWVHGDAFV